MTFTSIPSSRRVLTGLAAAGVLAVAGAVSLGAGSGALEHEGAAQAAAPASGYLVNDSHFHLTNYVQQGTDIPPGELVLHRAMLAKEAGFSGVVASGLEAAAIRNAAGTGFFIVTPGIRPQGGATQDQARVATPASAIAAGADYLVVGRPITAAPDPRAAAEAIVAEIERALSG
jgi:orotidine 5'-phosphate decarboxylase subfamily 1